MKAKQDNESEDLRGMRESIEEMEQDLKGIEEDIAEAKKIHDPEMREVAVRNLAKLRKGTREMIASFKETYRVMRESEERQAKKIIVRFCCGVCLASCKGKSPERLV